MSLIRSASLPYSMREMASRAVERDLARAAERSTAPQGGPSYVPGAQERAINRIIEIITGMKDDGGAGETPRVVEAGGSILEANGTSGDDDMTFKADTIFALNADSGDDTVTLKAKSASSIDAGDGADRLRLAALYLGDISGGAGDDTIEAKADLAMGLSGGSGNDTISVAARAILDLTGGDGDDTFKLEGERIFASGGAGDDTFAIRNAEGLTVLDFARGDGRDTITADGALDIRFTGPDAYGPDDLDVRLSAGTLTVTSRDGQELMSITLGAAPPSWSFSQSNGVTILSVR